MKVSIYRLPDGTMDLMVEASPGSGKGPVLARGITQENVKGVALPLINSQRGRRVRPDLG